MQKIIISHPTGNAFVRAAATAFLQADALSKFYTSIAIFKSSFLYKIGAWSLLSDIRRRTFDDRLKPFVNTFPFYEGGRLLSEKFSSATAQSKRSRLFSIDNVYQQLDKHVATELKKTAHKNPAGVYCYEDGAMHTFEAARAMGLQCIYDLPIGYWRTMHRLLEAERKAHPEWASTITGFYDPAEKLAQKDTELKLAHKIIVASSFTASTLSDFKQPLAPIAVVPYGFPPVCPNRIYQPFHSRPLKLLFVGNLSQRKGIANLFEAVERFGKKVALTIVGNKVVQNCKPLNEALAKHRWIPSLPHQDILRLMQQQDALVFPSLFEGFGLVITEAMSQGTPVITTERTAGPDIINPGENGWLVEAGDTQALINAIDNLLTNPKQLITAGKAAMEKAKERSWEVYGKELLSAISIAT